LFSRLQANTDNNQGAGMPVVGIGQCSWDYLAVVDRFPGVDSKAEVHNWQEQGGGPVATALVTLARLGLASRFYGVVGDDANGVAIRQSLQVEGIDTTGLLVRHGTVSQTAFIAIERDSAKRTIFWQRPTGAPLLPEELAADYLNGCTFLHLDGLFAEVSLAAARQARQRGIPVMLDAGRLRPGMLELATQCDYLVAAEQFAHDLGWDGDPASFQTVARELGAPVVTITRGSRGSVTYSGGECLVLPAFAVTAVDTTGAGDVFHGAYIYGLLQGWSLTDTIRFASAGAALNCTRIGGRSGIATRAATLHFLADNGSSITITPR
jgi:sulfofructose kinase